VKDSVHIPKIALAIKKTKMPINKVSAKTKQKLAGRNYSSPSKISSSSPKPPGYNVI
jgi:hypothetical protein